MKSQVTMLLAKMKPFMLFRGVGGSALLQEIVKEREAVVYKTVLCSLTFWRRIFFFKF